MIPIAELMVHEAMSFSAACQARGVKWEDSKAEHAAEFCEAYQNVLDGIRFQYFANTGNNPLLTKAYAAGQTVKAIDRLMQMDQPDKIAVLVKALGDLMGWFEVKPDVPVIANLTQDDIDRLREEVKAKEATQAQPVQVVIVDGGKAPN
jgi:hypothetical protein